MHTQLLSCVQLLATPWTVANQAPLSMGLPRQEYWSGLPCPSPGDLPNPEIGLQEDSLALSHLREISDLKQKTPLHIISCLLYLFYIECHLIFTATCLLSYYCLLQMMKLKQRLNSPLLLSPCVSVSFHLPVSLCL